MIYLNIDTINKYKNSVQNSVMEHPPKQRHFMIICNNCNSLLSYTENEQLGVEDVKNMLLQAGEYNGIAPRLVMPVKMYIYCCECGNKIHTSEVWANHPTIHYGTEYKI